MTSWKNMICLIMVMCGVGLAEHVQTKAPCRVGAQLHLRLEGAPETSYMKQLRAFVENDMASYVLLATKLPGEHMENVVRYLVDHDVFFLIQDVIVPLASEPQFKRRFSPEELERLQKLSGKYFLGIHNGELDSSGLKPEDYLAPPIKANYSRREVKQAFLDYISDGVKKFKAECPTIPMGHSSATLSHWMFAEAGIDIICSEIGENIPNINMMLASNRGTARAYKKPWMIDFSTWWAPRGNAGVLVSPREGHTPWLFFTSLLSAILGEADYVQLEVDWAAYNENYELLPWGIALKSLFSLAQMLGSRGETLTPFAIVLGHENGWPGVGWRVGDVRGAGLFDGIRHQFMQTRDADLSLKILDIFYPGFERCGWDPEYPGFLAESPFGPLDIVPNNLPVDTYSRYKVLVALGYHQATPQLIETWKTFVQNGGILICSDTAFRNEKESFVPAKWLEPILGCKPDFRQQKLITLYQPLGKLQNIPGLAEAGERIEWQYHRLHPVQLTTGTVVVTLNDVPFIIKNSIGSGHVFFITALNGVGSSETLRGQEPFLYANILYHFLHTLEDHVGTGVEFSPWTSLDYVLHQKNDESLWLLVMNHGDMNYLREGMLKRHGKFRRIRMAAQGDWQQWKPGEEIPFEQENGVVRWKFILPPKSFVLFVFER